MEEKITKDMIIDAFEKHDSFVKYNHMHIVTLNEDEAVLSCELTDNSLNPSGIAHGGIIFGLADTAMGTLAYLTGQKVVTVDSNINYLKPCAGQQISCVAKPVKVGKTLGVYEAKIYNEKQELAAVCSGTYLYLNREIKK